MSEDILYKVIYLNNDEIHEIYAEEVTDDALFGFIRVKGIQFNQGETQLVVDPNLEKLKQEFNGVTASFIPVHEVMRIDVVKSMGTPKIKEVTSNNKVAKFPKTFIPIRES